MLLEMTVCCIGVCTHNPVLIDCHLLCFQIMEIKWHYSICCHLLFVGLWVHQYNKRIYLSHLVQIANYNVISVHLKIITYEIIYILVLSISSV